MTKRLFAASLFVFLFASHVSAWDMGAYVENARAGEGISDSTFVWKDEQAQPATVDSSMAFDNEKRKEYRKQSAKYKEENVKDLQRSRFRHKFYLASLGAIGFQSLENTEYNKRQKQEEIRKHNGLLFPYTETRLGKNFADIVALYGAIGTGFGIGSYVTSAPKKDEEEITVTSIRAILGIGLEFYPFPNNEDDLYALYFGLCAGFAGEAVQEGLSYSTDRTNLDNFSNIFIRAEVGYDFWFGKRRRIGLVFSYAFGFINFNEGNDIDTQSHNFSLAIRFIR